MVFFDQNLKRTLYDFYLILAAVKWAKQHINICHGIYLIFTARKQTAFLRYGH